MSVSQIMGCFSDNWDDIAIGSDNAIVNTWCKFTILIKMPYIHTNVSLSIFEKKNDPAGWLFGWIISKKLIK